MRIENATKLNEIFKKKIINKQIATNQFQTWASAVFF